ncbi:MAG: alpha/beta hydrolase family protein [Lachnospiraceae bacterium]|nr:alpha/beta hydrolase family protein [Lachnospiraceae bacterium]
MAHIDCSFYSPSLKKNAHVIVFLPSMSADDYLENREVHYYDKDKKYPVLYLLHGSYGDCLDWSLRTGIERYAQDKQIAVVMPSGENSSYVNMAHGEAYQTYIGKELPEFMVKMFPVSEAREDTYIAGLSMGGYGAYRIGLEYPETFGYIAALSGAMDMPGLLCSNVAHAQKMPANYKAAVYRDHHNMAGTRDDLPTLLKEQLEAGVTLPKLYMTCGTEDFIYPSNEAFYGKACELGVQVTYEKFPGVHGWDYWDAHIKDVLKWLP